jgi:tetratricopeptide (TPR) repeat protein
MKKTVFWLSILLILSQTFVLGQGYKGQGKVKGVVTDQDGNPIEGVTIKMYSQRAASGFELTTDSNGKWRAFYIRGGPYEIELSKPGYLPKNLSLTISEYNANPDVDFVLQKIEGMALTEDLMQELKTGNTLYEEEKYEEAIEVYQKIVGEFPDAYILYKNIGNCYFRMEDYERAEEYYLKVLDKDPSDHEAKLSIGNTYANRNQDEKALEWYNKIDFENISDPTVLFNIGSNFYTQGQHQEALKYYRKAVEIKPDFLDALYQLGLVNLTLGNNQEAIQVFTDYLKHDSESERANQVRGFLEFLKKK